MIGSLILFGGGLFLLFGVPFFSESKLKGMGNRPVSVCIASTFVISIVYLTVMAYADAAPYKKFLIVPDKPMSEEARRGHVPLCRTRMLLLPQHSWTGRAQDRA